MPNLKRDLDFVDNEAGVSTGADEGLHDLVKTITDALQLKTKASREFLRISLANCLLMDRKQLDYGPHNIRKGGVFGCVLRASDKFERLFHLYNSGRRKRAVNESIEDTFRDVSNYMIIALMIELGRWPNE